MTRYEEIQNELAEKQYTWLVTGAAGFIGSNLVEKLLGLNQRVVGFDNFETGFEHNLDQAVEDANQVSGKNCSVLFHFIEGDIRVLEDCQKAMNWQLGDKKHGVDFVLHQAALGSVPRSIENPIQTNKANIDGFLNMLVSARDAKVKSFVYAASSSTYGDHPDLPKIEEKIGNPLSPYAVTKYVNELYAKVFNKTYGMKNIGLRYFNVFGKRQDPNGAYAAVIPKWIKGILDLEDVYINGDGDTSRDFCYIDNVVQINLLAALSGSCLKGDEIFNCAVGSSTSLNTLHDFILDKLREKYPSLKSNRKYREFRIGDVKHSLASIEKAKKLLGYNPQFDFHKGLEETVAWYISQRGAR